MPVFISVLGSTGSIGTQVLDVARRLGNDTVRIVGLSAQSNAELLIQQARELLPKAVCICDEDLYKTVAESLSGFGIQVTAGQTGMEEIASLPDVDRVVVSVAGTPGLAPTLKAIECGKDIALASKEVLVAAGHIVTEAARRQGVRMLPIDSEHSAIFQCLNGEDWSKIERIILTASGGPFRDASKDEMARVTPEQALAHPTWKMGRKVTVDSATLMNKGLEIIEAKWLFGVDPGQIEVVIHPQSIVHSMVRFCDGSTIAQLGLPDMRLPIQYALLYPDRIDSGLPRMDITEIGSLTFHKVEPGRFECLDLARQAAESGGSLCAVMNAADEVAVELFLARKIGFLDIPRIIREEMEAHTPIAQPSLDEIYAVDWETRRRIRARYGAS
ncbi:MAG: 1-deoxy-D-xylulose-5-phosphate reductoisomerase [Armatimonadota bacterium]|nr:1-deoxy-D-xylulose-5-phosphate reductoisomerase [Armatimonadota bacterium]